MLNEDTGEENPVSWVVVLHAENPQVVFDAALEKLKELLTVRNIKEPRSRNRRGIKRL
jgi:hypothetical protein